MQWAAISSRSLTPAQMPKIAWSFSQLPMRPAQVQFCCCARLVHPQPKAHSRIEGRGAFYFSVGVDGKVAIGAEAGLVHKLNVYHTNTGGSSIGIIHGATTLASGNTAVTISNAEIRLDDTGNTTALLAMTNLELDLDRDSSSVANSSLVCTNISASSNINANTLTVRNLALSIQVHNSATVTNWEAIRITAPSTFGGGVLTNKRAIITEAGAGNVGFGTLTPSAQLHVSGTVQLDLGSDAPGDVFYRSSGGTLTRLGAGTNGHVLTLAAGLPSWAAAPGGGGGSPGGSAIRAPVSKRRIHVWRSFKFSSVRRKCDDGRHALTRCRRLAGSVDRSQRNWGKRYQDHIHRVQGSGNAYPAAIRQVARHAGQSHKSLK